MFLNNIKLFLQIGACDNKVKTPYELWYGKPDSVKYFKVFGSNYYIKINEDDLESLTLGLMKESF